MRKGMVAIGLLMLAACLGHPNSGRVAGTKPFSSDVAPSTGSSTRQSDPFSLDGPLAMLRPDGPLSSTSPASTTRAQGRLLDAVDAFKAIHGREGFWRLVEDQSGVWWFESPRGQLEFLNMVQTVVPFQEGRKPGDPHFISRDWNGNDLSHWAQQTVRRIREVGFKGLGAWCDSTFHDLDVPMSQDLNLWAWAGGWTDKASQRLYSSSWSRVVEQVCEQRVAPLKNNSNLVGYYIDNELDWSDASCGPGAYFDHLPNSDPSRQQVLEVIHAEWPTLDSFNLAWKMHLADWNQVESWLALPRENTAAYAHLGHAWLSHLAADYFKATTALIHRYDPNHLIMGVRYRGIAPPEVVRASRGYTDAQSLNYYVGDACFDSDMFHMMYHESGQPIIISEYSFHSLDGHSGNRNTVGFQAQVPDQQARADGYRLMTTRLSRIPFVVGADWFQWFDESPAGRGTDGEDVNFGIVDINDQPYQLLTDAVRQTTPTLNRIHGQVAADPSSDVWCESYATKPTMHVPFLTNPPVLNGNLSHWAPLSKLGGMRREQTIGMNRSPVLMPDVYMGWTREGLYMAFRVFDNHIEAAPANGLWWTRDYVEFFISTRPVTSDETSYDLNCHQFFFVPGDNPNMRDKGGVVGQWHRGGDALADNLIPHPAIEYVARVFPDQYTVEMFIPAKALHGFDPDHEPALAFNVHIHDFHEAAEFFWSAPKKMQTNLCPNTWGALYLDPPAMGFNILPAIRK